MPDQDKTLGPTKALYSKLLKSALTGALFAKDAEEYKLCVLGGSELARKGETLIGIFGLNTLQKCIEDVLLHNVPGDFLEAGVWRGGSCIFMRALLELLGDQERRVFVCDSFQGCPVPSPDKWPADLEDPHSGFPWLAVSQAEVEKNFGRYDMLDERVIFVPGWFKDSLPNLDVASLAILRIDGDLYESVWQCLEFLYDKVVPGGWVIIDDWTLWRAQRAVNDFREMRGIKDEILPSYPYSAYWRKSA